MKLNSYLIVYVNYKLANDLLHIKNIVGKCLTHNHLVNVKLLTFQCMIINKTSRCCHCLPVVTCFVFFFSVHDVGVKWGRGLRSGKITKRYTETYSESGVKLSTQ